MRRWVFFAVAVVTVLTGSISVHDLQSKAAEPSVEASKADLTATPAGRRWVQARPPHWRAYVLQR